MYAGGHLRTEFDLAESYDLRAGGLFNVSMSGKIPYAQGYGPDIKGKIRYKSNTLLILVDGNKAERSRMEIFKKAQEKQPCDDQQLSKIRSGLSDCLLFSHNAVRTALKGKPWRILEAFGSDTKATRAKVAATFKKIGRECRAQRKYEHGFSCTDMWNACEDAVDAYVYPLTGDLVYCHPYFNRENPKARECSRHADPEHPNWHYSSPGTIIHEMSHIVSGGGIADYEHGLPDILFLNSTMSMKNADNYELFASHLALKCKPLCPSRILGSTSS